MSTLITITNYEIHHSFNTSRFLSFSMFNQFFPFRSFNIRVYSYSIYQLIDLMLIK